MERFVVRAALFLLIGSFIVGCRTTGAPPVSQVPERVVDLSAQVRLIDGTPVPGAELTVQCGRATRTVRADREGRFKLEGVPEGECQVVGERARVNQIVRAGSNLLRGSGPVMLTVKPVYRHTLSSGVEIDETLRRWTRRVGRKVRSEARAWMPLPYRDAPRGGEIKKLPLLDEKDRLVTLETPTRRNLVYLLPCSNKPDRVPGELAKLSGHPATGVSATLIATPACVNTPLPRQVTVLRGSDEVLWALSARPGALVVLDSEGMVLHRNGSGSVDDAVAFLERSWPPFAAARQVSVLSSHTVRIAAAARLIAQATEKVRARRYAAAHGLVDRALRLDPNLAEGHRHLAILKARLGDLSGAMREVSWWRSSFGEESADDLLDEIQQLTASR